LTVRHALGNLSSMRGPLSILNLFGRFSTGLAVRLLLGAALLIGASGCASNSYMGISYAPGAADASLQALARQAQAGDKQAQFELGIKLEQGSVGSSQVSNAIKLYRAASTKRGGTQTVLVPGNGGSSVTLVNTGPVIEAFQPAKFQLQNLQTLSHYGYPNKLWPNSFNEAALQDDEKLNTILRACADTIPNRSLCQSKQYKMLFQAVQYKMNFASCWKQAFGSSFYEDKLNKDDFRKNEIISSRSCISTTPVDSTQLKFDKDFKDIWLVAYIAWEINPDGPSEDLLNELRRSRVFIKTRRDKKSILAMTLENMTIPMHLQEYRNQSQFWWVNSCRYRDDKIHVLSQFQIAMCDAVYEIGNSFISMGVKSDR
jgi:hypothetical protein